MPTSKPGSLLFGKSEAGAGGGTIEGLGAGILNTGEASARAHSLADLFGNPVPTTWSLSGFTILCGRTPNGFVQCQPVPDNSYFGTADEPFAMCDANNHCSGTLDMTFYATRGNVKGKVKKANGKPATGACVAAFVLPPPFDAPFRDATTTTDADGRFDFVAAPPDRIALYRKNNWGVRIYPADDWDHKSIPRSTYAVLAGANCEALAWDSPGQRIGGVQSSQAMVLDLVADAARGACAVPPLEPLTDPDAIAFEAANGKIVTYTDQAGNVRMEPSMLPDPNSGDIGRVACLNTAVYDAGGNFDLQSAWRPPAYEAHLRDIQRKWELLRHNDDPECAALKTEVEAEKLKHQIVFINPNAPGSRHSTGQAIDINRNFGLPPGVNIDTLAAGCGLSRLPNWLVPQDPGHFSTDGH